MNRFSIILKILNHRVVRMCQRNYADIDVYIYDGNMIKIVSRNSLFMGKVAQHQG